MFAHIHMKMTENVTDLLLISFICCMKYLQTALILIWFHRWVLWPSVARLIFKSTFLMQSGWNAWTNKHARCFIHCLLSAVFCCFLQASISPTAASLSGLVSGLDSCWFASSRLSAEVIRHEKDEVSLCCSACRMLRKQKHGNSEEPVVWEENQFHGLAVKGRVNPQPSRCYLITFHTAARWRGAF